MDSHQPDARIQQLPLPGGGWAEFADYGDGELPGLFMSKSRDDGEVAPYCTGQDDQGDQDDGAAAALA